jgi:hypothetical protein
MLTARLKRIATISFAIWVSLISALFGFIVGLIFGFMSFLGFGLRYGIRYILLWALLTPTFFAFVGFLASLTGAAIYNALVRRHGGMIFDFEEIAPKAELPPPPPSFWADLWAWRLCEKLCLKLGSAGTNSYALECTWARHMSFSVRTIQEGSHEIVFEEEAGRENLAIGARFEAVASQFG